MYCPSCLEETLFSSRHDGTAVDAAPRQDVVGTPATAPPVTWFGVRPRLLLPAGSGDAPASRSRRQAASTSLTSALIRVASAFSVNGLVITCMPCSSRP